MTQDQIILLLDLRASKERGAASLGCNNRYQLALQLEKLGFARQHGFGPTSFIITDKGLKELKAKAYKPAKAAPPAPASKAPVAARAAGGTVAPGPIRPAPGPVTIAIGASATGRGTATKAAPAATKDTPSATKAAPRATKAAPATTGKPKTRRK